MRRLVLLSASLCLLVPPMARAELPPLIPRKVLFGNPVKAGPQQIALDAHLVGCLLPQDETSLHALTGRSAQQLADALRPLPHREYSIASIVAICGSAT